MKRFKHVLAWVAMAAGLAAWLPATASEARIVSIQVQKTNVVVEVEASADLQQVTLESSPRVGRRAWEPRAVQRLSAAGGEKVALTFTVPISPAVEILRVRGETSSPLPLSFFEGTNKFASGTGSGAGAGGPVFNAGPETSVPARDSVDSGTGDARAVVESDIWKLEGDTLFFFNQYRGLQVIDVANPDQPVLRGSHDLAAAGEQMYVIGGDKIVLLARDWCSYYGGNTESRLVLLRVENGVPRVIKELPVTGYILESRLVGSALYVVANSYREVPGTAAGAASPTWEWGTEISSYDLADFDGATPRSKDWISGYNNVITATDRFLLAAKHDYSNGRNYHSTVYLYDIRSPNGEFTRLGSVSPSGIVQDKFKMHVDGEMLAIASQENGMSGTRSVVQTWSLENPSAPRSLARLVLIENEQLFATRFQGRVLYAVTFLRIDPLWIVDLTDAASPRVTGHLDVPGWSTFIYPMGSRLLTVGHDNTEGWRTSVQLFDVANPAKPGLLSKILIGDSYSGSEANWDEKAFGVLPDEKLVLVPFYGNTKEKGWINGVQLIDLEPDTLAKRGVIEQSFGARRATMHRSRILSVSARELLSVNATDRDRPEITHSLELSWAADRVHLAGEYLLEVDSTSGAEPSLRVVSAIDPALQLGRISLGKLPYLGSTIIGSRLHVLQGSSYQVQYPEVCDDKGCVPVSTNAAQLQVSVYDLSSLPAATLVGQASKEDGERYYYGQFDPLSVRDGLIVWASRNSGSPYWWGYGRGGIAVDAVMAPGRGMDIIGPWYWGGAGQFVAVDVSNPQPQFASTLQLTSTNGWWSFGQSFTANGLVYTSHQASEYDPTFDPAPYVYSYWDGTKDVTVTNDPPAGMWVQRYFLDVVDFTDPREPLIRKPVNIPGSLLGLDRGGQLLYTQGYDLTGDRYWTGAAERISASAYDGVDARLIDSMALPQSWPHPTLSDRGYLYLGKPADDQDKTPALQVWTISESGKFQLHRSLAVEAPVQQFALFGSLLAAQSSAIELYRLTQPGQPELVGRGSPEGCFSGLLQGADGDPARGLWVPLGWYGVIHVPVKTQP